MSPRDPPVSASPAPGFQGCAAMPTDCGGEFWGSNSGLCAYMATALMTELSPQPNNAF